MAHRHDVTVTHDDHAVLWAPSGAGGRLVGPDRLTVVSEDCDRLTPEGTVVTVDIEVVEGAPVVKRLEVVGDDVTSAVLREIPIAEHVRCAMRDQVRMEWVDEAGEVRGSLGVFDPDMVSMPDASWWAYGRLLGLDPTKYLAEVHDISRSAAAQRVARARKAGELPATTRGAR